MKFKNILKSIGVAVLAFALGTQVWSQPVTQIVQTQSFNITSAELLALDNGGTNQVELIAAPGAGKEIVILNVVYDYKAGSTPYTLPSGLSYLAIESYRASDSNSDGLNACLTPGLLDQSVNTIALGMSANVFASVANQSATNLPDTQSAFENTSIVLNLDGTPALANGNGTLTITITFATVTL